jgi:hypothetical protein
MAGIGGQFVKQQLSPIFLALGNAVRKLALTLGKFWSFARGPLEYAGGFAVNMAQFIHRRANQL